MVNNTVKSKKYEKNKNYRNFLNICGIELRTAYLLPTQNRTYVIRERIFKTFNFYPYHF